MASIPNQPPAFAGGQIAVSTTPVTVGGTLQGNVGLLLFNQGNAPCVLWAVMDGSTPTQTDMLTNGLILGNGGLPVAVEGVVASQPGSGVIPQYWIVCGPDDSTSLAWQERAL